MSDFLKEYINYSGIELPLYTYTYPMDSGSNREVIFKGKTYYCYTKMDNISGVEFPSWVFPQGGVYNSNIPIGIFYALKSKNEEIYLLFVKQTNNSIYIAINDKLDTSGMVIINSGTYGAMVNYNPRIFMDISNGYLFWFGAYTYKLSTYSPTYYDMFGMGVNLNDVMKITGELEVTNFSPTYGNASDKGGYSGGSFDNSSDTIAIPTKPTIGVSNIGFVNVYCPSQNALVNLGSELFPDFTPPPTPPVSADVAEALQMGLNNVVDNISNFTNMFINSKLIDYVIDCHCIPVQPTNTGSENIKIGFKSFTPTAPKATVDYVDFDCGTLNIKEYYSNFIDYVGTKAKLYLPFVGFVPIENEYFQNGLLQVIYRFNIIDGSFMAYVLSSSSKSELSNSVIASYGGNACVHIPITGLNYSNMVSGIASGTVATIATASINKGLGAVTAVNSALNTLSSKPSMQSSNGYNSTSAYLGIRYPYLIIEREVSNFSELYNNENGLPCNITKKISDLSGFIQMDNCHMETLPCMEEEKEMIQTLLSSGIIV